VASEERKRVCWSDSIRRRRSLAGLIPACLLACAIALATAPGVAAAPATTPSSDACPATKALHHGCTTPAPPVGRGHHGARHRSSPPPPGQAPAPPAASAPPPQRITFVSDAGVAERVGRTVGGGTPATAATPAPPGSAPPSVGGILTVPQPTLGGGAPLVDAGGAAGVWQVIAGAEGVAVLALLAALARHRRAARRRGL
jgi:hypothetical protein